MATFLATFKNKQKKKFETGSKPVLISLTGSKPALNQFQTLQTGLDHLKLYFCQYKRIPVKYNLLNIVFWSLFLFTYSIDLVEVEVGKQYIRYDFGHT